ncbi:hypothetical protein FEDK69T_27720 [Flavobacterium enshiense DK69]|uniref:Uncharacterized protein n=1 Tax=Flavobacterium enshiense DK69 TaxID=1107311 RepID=V6S7A3_9FLAO|nr:hypothetical protein [Flavobacterium enshiense]ESU20260.1 hypothetical protein FEDK69T_27720 [Flavobacterium enshiense DK69]KGO95926.1 hypothetical protein Q767_09615 [Flavobacterium enshiense DK69]
MKRLANIGLLITSLFGYTEWGKGRSAFLYEIEYELLFRQPHLLESLTHPLILGSLGGQLILLYCAIKNNSSKKLNLLGLVLLSLLMLLVLLVGILSSNFKIILSTTPFLCFTVLLIIAIKKERLKTSL